MAQPVMQKSFAAGELAPALGARVDLAKYHAAAALMRNFFVDYRGGASSRMGTKYILQAFKSSSAVRLIPFQASISVGYILEFGDFYIRFYYAGAPVLETATTITGATKATPGVLAIATHGYSVGDWVYVSTVVGMTQLNGNYYRVNTVPDANHIGLGAILDSSNLDTSGYTTYVSSGTAQRVYTLASPYAAADLSTLTLAQNVNTLILTQTNYPPYILTLISSASWTLTPIVFGSTVSPPTGLSVATTLSAGSANYLYIVTSVDVNGQESVASSPAALASKTYLTIGTGTNTVSWTGAAGAQYYNIYRAPINFGSSPPAASIYGYIGSSSDVLFVDTGITADFSSVPPSAPSAFSGGSISGTSITAPGTYSTVPTITFAAAPTGGYTATGYSVAGVISISNASASTNNWQVGDNAIILNNGAGAIFTVLTVLAGTPTSWTIINPGAVTSGSLPTANVVLQKIDNGAIQCTIVNMVWGIKSITITYAGLGYSIAPAITFSAGAAAATATVTPRISTGGGGPTAQGYPTVPQFFQQRLVLAAPSGAPQTFYMSRTGSPYNYNTSVPSQSDDAIQGSIISSQLNTIRALVAMPVGLIAMTSSSAWLINGGQGGGAPVTPASIVANSHAYNGISGVPPIVSNFDILYVQSKGSIVRDLTYNFYTNIFTGTDISVLSSHLFYGYTILEWCWCEEPFKIVWAVRNDGRLLSLTFLKEQELIGWASSDTTGLFKSVATITEAVSTGAVDALYTCVQRVIAGNTVKYIERMAERIFPNGATDAWCVDAGIQYSGAPATSFTGGQHLSGATITGLADGVAITPFVMAASGNFTLGTAASKVTVGLAFTPALQTLAIDTGEPTIQGKPKKIPGVTVRVAETLGLSIGSSSGAVVPMKDLVIGQVSGMLTGQPSQTVTGLVTGDAYTLIDPTWTVPGQYYISQPYPFPATILGVIPELTVGDTAK